MKNIAMACVAAGHGVTVFTSEWTGEKIPGVHVKVLSVNQRKTRKRDVQFVRLFQKTLETSCFDLKVGFNKIPGLDVYYSGDTCFSVKAHENHGWFYRMTPRCRTQLEFERAVFARGASTRILTVAKAQQADYQKYFQTETDRFHLIPPGISQDRIAPQDRSVYGMTLRKDLGMDPSWQVVTMVASNLSLKGYHRSLKAFISLPEGVRACCALLLVGADPRIHEYGRQIRALGITSHVRFLGGREDVPEILFGSDLLIHPAQREATGNVLLEAAVAGVPVLCSEICGYSFYISRYGLGRVVKEPFVQETLNTALHQYAHQPGTAGRVDVQCPAIFKKQGNFQSSPAGGRDI